MKLDTIPYLVYYHARSANQRTLESLLPPVSLFQLPDYIESRHRETITQKICSNLLIMVSIIATFFSLILNRLVTIISQTQTRRS